MLLFSLLKPRLSAEFHSVLTLLKTLWFGWGQSRVNSLSNRHMTFFGMKHPWHLIWLQHHPQLICKNSGMECGPPQYQLRSEILAGVLATKYFQRLPSFFSVIKIVSSLTCYLCGEDEETTAHVLWGCPYAEKVWRSNPVFNVLPMGENLLFQDILQC